MKAKTIVLSTLLLTLYSCTSLAETYTVTFQVDGYCRYNAAVSHQLKFDTEKSAKYNLINLVMNSVASENTNLTLLSAAGWLESPTSDKKDLLFFYDIENQRFLRINSEYSNDPTELKHALENNALSISIC